MSVHLTLQDHTKNSRYSYLFYTWGNSQVFSFHNKSIIYSTQTALSLPYPLLKRGGDTAGYLSPARPRTFAAGDAGRRGDGRGARCSPVDSSSSSFSISLLEFGFMPEFGEMPMGIWPPARPSRVRWLLVLLLSVVVVGSLLPEGLELESSIISLEFVESLICKEAGCFFSAAEAIVVMARGCWRCRRLHLTGWVRAHCGGRRDGGAGGCVRGRRPADVVVLLHPLAEGRLFLIPPSCGAIWEALLLLVGSHGVALWRPRRPKWLVPRRRRGESGVELVDPIAFFISVQGPPCISSRTCLYHLVSFRSYVVCAVLVLNE